MKKIVLALLLGGCSSASYFARISSGHVGCPVHAMLISDESTLLNGSQSWTVTCHGRDYYCSRDGESNVVACAKDEAEQ